MGCSSCGINSSAVVPIYHKNNSQQKVVAAKKLQICDSKRHSSHKSENTLMTSYFFIFRDGSIKSYKMLEKAHVEELNIVPYNYYGFDLGGHFPWNILDGLTGENKRIIKNYLGKEVCCVISSHGEIAIKNSEVNCRLVEYKKRNGCKEINCYKVAKDLNISFSGQHDEITIEKTTSGRKIVFKFKDDRKEPFEMISENTDKKMNIFINKKLYYRNGTIVVDDYSKNPLETKTFLRKLSCSKNGEERQEICYFAEDRSEIDEMKTKKLLCLYAKINGKMIRLKEIKKEEYEKIYNNCYVAGIELQEKAKQKQKQATKQLRSNKI